MADLSETAYSLLGDVKQALRVTSDDFDEEIAALSAAALRDMERQGVKSSLLEKGKVDPLAKIAVMLFCKARFGFDNDDAERFEAAYAKTLKDLANSPTLYAETSE